jgi:peptidoglycan hydrolase CwlO-like protein
MPTNMILSPMQRDYLDRGEFGEFREEFKGFKSYVEDGFEKVFEQADNVESTLISRIDTVEANLGKKIDRVEAKVDSLESKVGGLESKISSIGSKMDSMSTQITLLTKVVNKALK